MRRDMVRIKQRRPSESGAMLIIAFGVLVLISLIGVTFATLMRLEKQATQGFLYSERSDFLNDSAVAAVVADIRGADNFFHYTPWNVGWLYQVSTSVGRDFAAGAVPLEKAREVSLEGELLPAVVQTGKDGFRTKVLDCSSQINLNMDSYSLPMIIDHLGMALRRSRRLNVNYNPFYTQARERGRRIWGEQIVAFRNRLEGRRFKAKSDLIQIIGPENFEILKDFVTVHSWVDDTTWRPADAANPLDPIDVELRAGMQRYHPTIAGVPRITREPRAPINLNTAPQEVLVAVLWGISARRAFPYVTQRGGQPGYQMLPMSVVDRGYTPGGKRSAGLPAVEVIPPEGYEQRPVWVYSQPLSYENALNIANAIIEHRRGGRPFMTWSTGNRNSPGFSEFIHRLESSNRYFPPPQNVMVIDPANPRDRRPESAIQSGARGLEVWTMGHDPLERSARQNAGLPAETRYAFYYEMVKGAIVANFNPNTRLNKFNPNRAAWMPVDKSGLVSSFEEPRGASTFQRGDRIRLVPGYTTEGCFDAMGVFEITSISDVKDAQKRELARRDERTVVEVYGVVRHTTQRHFEQPFNERGYSSTRNRENIATYPNNMEALTEYLSGGSEQDGNIQLAGYVDGLRWRMNENDRAFFYQRNAQITTSHGFNCQKPQVRRQIAQQVRSGGSVVMMAGDGSFASIVQNFFDPEFSRSGARYSRRYTQVLLSQVAQEEVGLNKYSAYAEPSLGPVERGTSVVPDGFVDTIFKSDPTNTRPLYWPARELRSPQNREGARRQRGTNAIGNVPYYRGGVAFWVKFAFDGRDPVFSGLLGCTQVQTRVTGDPKDMKGSEGTQFFVFREPNGLLRVVRMYYHRAFARGSNILMPAFPEEMTGEEPGKKREELDIDPSKQAASRYDVWFDTRNWRAHDWHHVGVVWNDSNYASTVQLYIDFERMGVEFPIAGPATEGFTVSLNERDPSDGLFVGGFIRRQADPRAGLFMWRTDIDGQTGRMIGDNYTKRMNPNATIDEFVVFEGQFTKALHYNVLGYFTRTGGQYSNVMEVPIPHGVDAVKLRSFTWTEYQPAFYWSHRGVQPLDRGRIECMVLGPDNTQITVSEAPWRELGVQNGLGGRYLYRATGQLAGESAKLVYVFRMNPITGRQFQYAGAPIGTPVIDDVTLAYYLPSARIVLREEASAATP